MTDRRLFFVQDGMLSKTTEDFPYSKISSVSWQSGLAMGTIIVFASGNKAEIKNVQKDDGKEIVELLRQRLAASDAPTSASTPPVAAPDVMAQLKQLGELKEAGVLSQSEFDAKKAELLARL